MRDFPKFAKKHKNEYRREGGRGRTQFTQKDFPLVALKTVRAKAMGSWDTHVNAEIRAAKVSIPGYEKLSSKGKLSMRRSLFKDLLPSEKERFMVDAYNCLKPKFSKEDEEEEDDKIEG
eukprot:3938728-Rhodomonas_salina.1